jgi:hypothetical protein
MPPDTQPCAQSSRDADPKSSIAAYFPKRVLSEGKVFAKLRTLADELESFDPNTLEHACLAIPFVRYSCEISCNYSAERYVHDHGALQAARKRREERYDAWCDRDEPWRMRNHFNEPDPKPNDYVRYEKDVAGMVAISRDFGLYCGVAEIPVFHGAYVPWELNCRAVLKRLNRVDFELVEIGTAFGTLPVDREVYRDQFAKDVDAALEHAIRADSKTDSQRMLRALDKVGLTYKKCEETTTYIPLHAYCSEEGAGAGLVLIDGCLGEVWTSFRPKPPPPPLPAPAPMQIPVRVATPPPSTPPPQRKTPLWIAASLLALLIAGLFQAYLSGRLTTGPSRLAQPAVQPFAVSREYVVVPSRRFGSPRVDLRAGPGRAYALVLQLWVGDRVIGSGIVPAESGAWIQVTREDGASGFVAEQFLRPLHGSSGAL